jgi:hypothetical protein
MHGRMSLVLCLAPDGTIAGCTDPAASGILASGRFHTLCVIQ